MRGAHLFFFFKAAAIVILRAAVGTFFKLNIRCWIALRYRMTDPSNEVSPFSTFIRETRHILLVHTTRSLEYPLRLPLKGSFQSGRRC